VANTGDLFVNFKVNADGLQSGFAALNGFVGKSKRDLAAMDGAVNALSSTLAKLGIDPSFIFQMRDLVQIGTKQIPKVVEGIAALERQAGALAGMKITAPKLEAPVAAAAATVAPAVDTTILPPIDLAPIDGVAKAIRSVREQATGDIDILGSTINNSPILSMGGAVEAQMAKARASFSSGSVDMADAIVLGSSRIEEAIVQTATVTKAQGGAITAALGKVRDFTGTIPARFVALRESMSSAFSSGATAATGALSKIGPAISSLPTLASTAFGRIKAGFQGLPAASSTAFEAIKSGAMKFDATLTGVAARAATAGRAIGAALYTALGPIGLILVAAGALYAVIDKFVSDAEARVAESNARIEANMQRTQAVIERTMAAVESLNKDTASARSKSTGTQADIEGLQALLNARADQVALIEQQIAAERELRDEVAANIAANKAVADAVAARAKAEQDVADAQRTLQIRNQQVAEGAIDETAANEAAAQLSNMRGILSAMQAQEDAAKALAGATANNLALEEQRVDLAQQLTEQTRLKAEAEQRSATIAQLIQGFDDERLRLTMDAADYEEMILDRKIAAAGITDPNDIARIKAAQDALNLAKQQAEAEKIAKSAAGEKNTIAQETIRITEEARALQSAIDSIANEQAALEREMLELTMGKAAAEEHILRMKAQAAGLDAAATNDLIEQLKAVQDLRDAVAERKRTEAEQNRLLDERTRLEASIADATEAARAKAMEDDLRRQQMTETVSTAIGGLKIAATSDAIDIDKRIFDETKKQTDELKKINAALSAGGVAVLT
jgi:hypothetical protein